MNLLALSNGLAGVLGGLAGVLIGALAVGLWAHSFLKAKFQALSDNIDSIESGRYSPPKKIGDDSVLQIASSVFDLKQAGDQRAGNMQEYGQRLNSVLNNMVEGVIVLDENHGIAYANRASQELLSISSKDIQGRSILELVRNPAIENAVSRCFKDREPIETEFETIRGLRRTLALRVTWMPEESQVSAMMVLNDVTNLRQLENMRTDFVANVSHELKTPLASIKAYAETLRRGGLDDKENRLGFVHTIEDQANRLHQLIIDLIQLSRIEQGKAAFQISEVDLCSLLDERCAVYKDVAEKSKIHLDLKIPEKEIWAKVEDEGMQTIIDNLITNAIRYTPSEGSVHVSCRLAGNSAVIEVKDTGIGIAPEHQERIFERFYRVDKARSREKGGTGLGLSIVKHLAQSFGGGIELESSIGRGTKFSVFVPLVDKSANLAS